MASLVADYSSDSDSTDNSGSSDAEEKKVESTALPKPDFKTDTSVFINPFVEADKAKTAILEKHVKMISTDVKTVNGKKICWNYRKNRCRFGHKCKYAHDSDLQLEPPKNDPEMNLQDVKVQQSGNDLSKQQICFSKTKKRPVSEDSFVPCGKIAKTANHCKPKTKGYTVTRM